jgi:hypothetical protein
MSKREKPPIYVVKRNGGLFGEFDMDARAISELPNTRVKVSLYTGRYPPRLRWYWRFLQKVIDATDCAPDTEALHNLIKMATDYTVKVKIRDFHALVPRSISFASMKEEEFMIFCANAELFIAETYGILPSDVGECRHENDR